MSQGTLHLLHQLAGRSSRLECGEPMQICGHQLLSGSVEIGDLGENLRKDHISRFLKCVLEAKEWFISNLEWLNYDKKIKTSNQYEHKVIFFIFNVSQILHGNIFKKSYNLEHRKIEIC